MNVSRETSMPLWQQQVDALAWMAEHRRSWLRIPIGGGKTRTVCERIRAGGHRRVLVLAPSRVTKVWRGEVPKWLPEAKLSWLAPGTPTSDRAAQLDPGWTVLSPHVAVTNYEAILQAPFAKAVRKWKPDLIVLDECHRLKAPQGRLFRDVRKLVKELDCELIAMTGTIQPHSPLDLWSQAKLVDPDAFPGPFGRYKSAVSVLGGPSQSWVVASKIDPADERNYDLAVAAWLAGTLRDIVFMADVEQKVGLVSTFREHTLPREIRSHYDRLLQDMVLQLEEGEVAPANRLVQQLRLAQLASGALPLDEGYGVVTHDERFEALLEQMDDADEPVIVGCRFKHELYHANVAAQQLGRSYGEISGARSDGLNADGKHAGQDVVAVQYQAGGEGIDLSAASLAIVVGHIHSLGMYDQFIGRMRRPGQKEDTVRVAHLLAEDTVDQAVYRALADRRSVQEAVEEAVRALASGRPQDDAQLLGSLAAQSGSLAAQSSTVPISS